MSYELSDIIKMYKTFRMSVYVVLAFLVTALITTFINRSIAFAAVACALCSHLFVSRRLQKRYVSMVNTANILHTVCRLTGSQSVSEKDGCMITAQTIISSELMPCGYKNSTPLLCWGVSGRMKGLPVSLCDATIPQEFHLAKNGKSRIHFNSGVWTHIDLPCDTGLDIRLLDETSVSTPIRMEFFEKLPGYSTAPIGDRALAEKTVLYRRAGNTAEIPVRFLKRFKDLVGYTTGYAAVSIRHDRMDVFIRGRFLAMPVTVSKAPGQAVLEFDPFPELSYIMDMAGVLAHAEAPRQLPGPDNA